MLIINFPHSESFRPTCIKKKKSSFDYAIPFATEQNLFRLRSAKGSLISLCRTLLLTADLLNMSGNTAPIADYKSCAPDQQFSRLQAAAWERPLVFPRYSISKYTKTSSQISIIGKRHSCNILCWSHKAVIRQSSGSY